METGIESENADFIWRKELLGAWLRWLRVDRGYSQRQLEALSGVNDAEIHRIESGQQECRIETLLRLCGPLGVTAGWVLDRAFGTNVGIYHERVKNDEAFTRLLAELGIESGNLRSDIASNLASACVVASILLRSSAPKSRFKAVTFPQEEWEKRFASFVEALAGLDEGPERATMLHGLLTSPVRELEQLGLLPRAVLKAQIENAKLPRSKRESFGWSNAAFVEYPRPTTFE